MDDTGKMTPEERNSVIAYLTKMRPVAPPCDFCASVSWNVCDHIILPFFYGTRLPSSVDSAEENPPKKNEGDPVKGRPRSV